MRKYWIKILVTVLVFTAAVFSVLLVRFLGAKHDREVSELRNDIDKMTQQRCKLKEKLSNYMVREKEAIFIAETNPSISVADAAELLRAVDAHYPRTGLEPYDLLSICVKESTLNKEAANPDGTGVGICQINPGTYASYRKQKIFTEKPDKLYQIDYNVYVASVILETNRRILERKYTVGMFSIAGEDNSFVREQYDRFMNKLLISSYNRSPSTADVNADYVKQVLKIKSTIR